MGQRGEAGVLQEMALCQLGWAHRQPLPAGASNRTGCPWSVGPATRAPLGDGVRLSTGYLGFYMFYVVTVVLCTWVYQWQRRRSLVCSMPGTPGKV